MPGRSKPVCDRWAWQWLHLTARSPDDSRGWPAAACFHCAVVFRSHPADARCNLRISPGFPPALPPEHLSAQERTVSGRSAARRSFPDDAADLRRWLRETAVQSGERSLRLQIPPMAWPRSTSDAGARARCFPASRWNAPSGRHPPSPTRDRFRSSADRRCLHAASNDIRRGRWTCGTVLLSPAYRGHPPARRDKPDRDAAPSRLSLRTAARR